MSGRRSLAQLTLEWCLRDVLGNSPITTPEVSTAGFAGPSREALRSAGVALLQAAASAEVRPPTIEALANALEDDNALARFEEDLVADAHEAKQVPTSTAERAAFVGKRTQAWLAQPLKLSVDQELMSTWLVRGWPELTVRGGTLSFYQAFCRALHRIIRRDHAAIQHFLEGVPLDATTWRQWLIREGEIQNQLAPTSSRWPRAMALTVAIGLAALAGRQAWSWWISKTSAVVQQSASMGGNPVSGNESEKSNSPPAATSAPVARIASSTPSPAAPDTLPVPVRIPESTPRVTPGKADSMPEIRQLIAEAERAVVVGRPDGSEALARRAQESLYSRLPAHDADLADLLERLGLYWEQRSEWAEAVRLHQKAVQSYEKTSAENAAPQLQAVNRWAGALRHAGRNTEAERLYRTLLEAYESTGPVLQPDAATVAHNLANVLFATGRLREARQLYGKALSLIADVQEDPAAQRLIEPLRRDYGECLRALGVSDLQIDADIRKVLGEKSSSQAVPNR